MFRKTLLLLAALVVNLPFSAITLPAFAQSDEIIVTGSRLERFSNDVTPAVTLTKTPDFILVQYTFRCDTRDRAKREKELKTTLKELLKRANARDDIQLSTIIEFEDGHDTLYFPTPYTKVNSDDFLGQYGRADVSQIEITVKTPVDDGISSLDDAEMRIEEFVDSIKMTGRTEAISSEEVQLSIKNVDRYRPELLSAILAESEQLKTALSGSRVSLSGLENVVRWERTGPLDLEIYIPYKIAIEVE